MDAGADFCGDDEAFLQRSMCHFRDAVDLLFRVRVASDGVVSGAATKKPPGRQATGRLVLPRTV